MLKQIHFISIFFTLIFVSTSQAQNLTEKKVFTENYDTLKSLKKLTNIDKSRLGASNIEFGLIEDEEGWKISNTNGYDDSTAPVTSQHPVQIDFISNTYINLAKEKGISEESAIERFCNPENSLSTSSMSKNIYQISLNMPGLTFNNGTLRTKELQNLNNFEISDIAILFIKDQHLPDSGHEESFVDTFRRQLSNSDITTGGTLTYNFNGNDRIACALMNNEAELVVSFSGDYESIDMIFEGYLNKDKFIDTFKEAEALIKKVPSNLKNEFASAILLKQGNIFDYPLDTLFRDKSEDEALAFLSDMTDVVSVWKQYNSKDNTYPLEAFYNHFGEIRSYNQDFYFNYSFSASKK